MLSLSHALKVVKTSTTKRSAGPSAYHGNIPHVSLHMAVYQIGTWGSSGG